MTNMLRCGDAVRDEEIWPDMTKVLNNWYFLTDLCMPGDLDLWKDTKQSMKSWSDNPPKFIGRQE